MQLNRRFTPARPPEPGSAQASKQHDDSTNWRTRANCLAADPELFFPDPSAPAGPALAVCNGCLVREDCLAHALRRGERFGVWGGTSERRRRRLLAARAGVSR